MPLAEPWRAGPAFTPAPPVGLGDGPHSCFRPELVAETPTRDARELLGEMALQDTHMARRAEELSLRVDGHPRLRYNADDREHRRRLASEHPEYAEPLVTIIADLDARKAEEPYVLTAQTNRTRRPVFGAGLLAVRPPEPPELLSGQGADPFPGMTVEGAWRQLYWHDFSHWLIGAALSDDPVFAEQARRWAVTLARWRFWLQPDYIYFDFGSSYPLQCLCTAYDVAFELMTEGERAEVRAAIATIAEGLYTNTLSGHGSICNDLRGITPR